MSPPESRQHVHGASLRIAVAGAARCDIETLRRARRVGREIAAAGAILLCGGGSGVMQAAAEGAREAGGRTIGILPGAGPDDSPPNPAIELPLYTALGQARNLVLVVSADVVIAVGGEWGTLSEIALARKYGRPVVTLESWTLEPPGGTELDLPIVARSARDAVQEAVRLVRSGGVST